MDDSFRLPEATTLHQFQVCNVTATRDLWDVLDGDAGLVGCNRECRALVDELESLGVLRRDGLLDELEVVGR
ncbi:hypothetical protein C490_17524 [Natronobacterium gregoryi SP2]|uniref:Uncharacterized protein n=1 Tax=Natronobacterium gregoryi (strain ATCC 43098 / DSM 3393 / CCM 3738 / CIP 104747 / IAM 13177 / JCM 8860 / NBRC 102187 / NCIMB 2189 / SP2) TaxID=797304 RepID=L9XM69_NATGS|nr:hypothetical protein C490_17524 [Natronobacterium gregoryi SP2]